MAKIIGNITATLNPSPDWNQADETKADYIKNKPTILTEDEIVALIAASGGVTGGGGDVGDNVLRVFFDDGVCSHTASQIWDCVEAGGRVDMLHVWYDRIFSLVSCDVDYALFMEISDDPPFTFVEVGNNGANTFEYARKDIFLCHTEKLIQSRRINAWLLC